METIKLSQVRCVIREAADGWDVTCEGLTAAHVRSAAEGSALVIEHVRRLPYSSILTVEWEPRTPIGRQVVRVLTQ